MTFKRAGFGSRGQSGLDFSSQAPYGWKEKEKESTINRVGNSA